MALKFYANYVVLGLFKAFNNIAQNDCNIHYIARNPMAT